MNELKKTFTNPDNAPIFISESETQKVLQENTGFGGTGIEGVTAANTVDPDTVFGG